MCSEQTLPIMRLVKLVVIIVKVISILFIIVNIKEYKMTKDLTHVYLRRLVILLVIFFLPSIILASINEEDYSCYKGVNIFENTFPVIEPEKGSNIVASDESKTLKIKIVKEKKRYISYIWVKDAYNQFNKELASNYGLGRENLASVLQRVIYKRGKNKIYLAVNASGLYVNGKWTPKTKSYNNQYNNTQQGGLVISDGAVIRNWYYDDATDKSRNNVIYAIDKNNNLVFYPNMNKMTENERKEYFQKIIDSGIRNTITFRPILIKDGEIVSWKNDTTKNDTTAFCQINRNNFIIYSTVNNIPKNVTVEELKSLGCKTAVNFDGGGSVALYFKDKKGDIKIMTGGTRDNVELFYVTE